METAKPGVSKNIDRNIARVSTGDGGCRAQPWGGEETAKPRVGKEPLLAPTGVGGLRPLYWSGKKDSTKYSLPLGSPEILDS